MTSIPAERRVRPANARATTRPRSGAVLRRASVARVLYESNAPLAHTAPQFSVSQSCPAACRWRPPATSRARRCQQPARWPGHSPGWQGRRQVRVAPSLLRLRLTGRVRFLGLPDATKHERACDWGTEENERKTTDRRIAPRFAGKCLREPQRHVHAFSNFREKTQRAGLVRPTPSARASSRVSASPPRFPLVPRSRR